MTTVTILDSQDVDNTQYSVWVGGTEVNDYLVDYRPLKKLLMTGHEMDMMM